MFVQPVKPAQSDRDGFFCYLMETVKVDGKSRNKTVLSFGFVPSERVPYLKAAFDRGNPAEIFERVSAWVEARRPSAEQQD